MTRQTTTDVLGVTEDDVGEPVTLRYQSVYNPDAGTQQIDGRIESLYPENDILYIYDEEDRLLEVTPRSVLINRDADWEYQDRSLGDDPEVTVTAEYEVQLSGALRVTLTAEDAETARQQAIEQTDFGDLNQATDRNAARRLDE